MDQISPCVSNCTVMAKNERNRLKNGAARPVSDPLSLVFPHYLSSVYPHGCTVSAGLILSTMAALVATLYAVSSCRLVVVSYVSEHGNFDTLFDSESEAGNGLQRYDTAAGLFQWLAPTSSDEWAVGTCVGYTQTILGGIADTTMEVTRVMAVLATIMGVAVTFWIFALACISLGLWQVRLLAFSQLCMTILVSLTLLVTQSGLCTNVGQSTTCQLDKGGMVAIAGAILWFMGFMISACALTSPEKAMRERKAAAHAEYLALAAELALQRQKRARKTTETSKSEQARPEQSPSTPPPKLSPSLSTVSTPDTVESFGATEEEKEVYISRRVDRIEELMEV